MPSSPTLSYSPSTLTFFLVLSLDLLRYSEDFSRFSSTEMEENEQEESIYRPKRICKSPQDSYLEFGSGSLVKSPNCGVQRRDDRRFPSIRIPPIISILLLLEVWNHQPFLLQLWNRNETLSQIDEGHRNSMDQLMVTEGDRVESDLLSPESQDCGYRQ